MLQQDHAPLGIRVRDPYTLTPICTPAPLRLPVCKAEAPLEQLGQHGTWRAFCGRLVLCAGFWSRALKHAKTLV